MRRRSFIEMFVAGTAGFVGLPELDINEDNTSKWEIIKKQFPDSSSQVLNFNNGSAGMIPLAVEQQVEELTRIMNRMAPYEALDSWSEIINTTRVKLSHLIGAQEEEVAIVRNTTEALNFVLGGIEIPKHSTVVCAKHDYGHAVNILERLSEEKGFIIKYVDVVLPAGQQEIIKAYKGLIDENCSLVLLTAMTHREGQILPIKKITKHAQRHGALVVVDAAHAIGHFEHSVKDWACDYYCTSLHKWLSCPLGSGLLYMKRDRVIKTKGSYSAERKLDESMLKFEVVGTKPFAISASILSAINFQESIGFKVKQKRLKALTDYWVEGVKETPNIITYKPGEYGAVTAFNCIENTTKFLKHLSLKKIHLKKVYSNSYPKISRTRYRVSPNIYHDFNDLDRLIEAIKTYEI